MRVWDGVLNWLGFDFVLPPNVNMFYPQMGNVCQEERHVELNICFGTHNVLEYLVAQECCHI